MLGGLKMIEVTRELTDRLDELGVNPMTHHVSRLLDNYLYAE